MIASRARPARQSASIEPQPSSLVATGALFEQRRDAPGNISITPLQTRKRGRTPVWEGERVEWTNARGRHTYVPAFKRWIVEHAQRPGLSVAGLALSNQVNANQLRRWVQLHGKASAGPSATATLLPVTIVAQTAAAAPEGPPAVPVDIEVVDAIVRVPAGATATTLRMVLTCLRGTAP